MTWLNTSPPSPIWCDDLTIRQYELSDAATLRNAVRDNIEHLRPFMPWVKFEPQTLDEKEDLIAGWQKLWQERSEFVMGIFRGPVLVGGTGFHLRSEPGVLEIGFWVDRNNIRKGIATSVSRRLTSVAFEIEDVHAVEIAHDKANVASGRVPEKIGFVISREYERTPEAPSESGHAVVWRISRDDWASKGQTSRD